ncbi:MAG TPA: electron transporter RnfB, partial [Dyella sp.]|nr:electron transporter RnfB [Dyella sp.]
PVDCIVLEPMPLAQTNDPTHIDAARTHFQRREARLAAQSAQREAELTARKAQMHNTGQQVSDVLARAKAKKQEPKT